MGNEELDNEGLENQNNDDTSSTDSKSQNSTDSKTSGNEVDLDKYVSKESYQGLQRVVAKRDADIETLKQTLEDVTTQLEEMKTNTSSVSAEKDKLEKSIADAQALLNETTAERDKLNKQLEQQGVIMQEFPDLAPLAEYIPGAEDTEAYRESAKKFQEALKGYVKEGVKQTLSGSSPPAPGDGQETVDEAEEEALWKIVFATSGVPGREKEFAEANDKLQRILASKEK